MPDGKDMKLPSDFKGITPISYSIDAGDTDLSSSLGPTVTQIKKTIRALGIRASLAQAK